MFLRGPRPVLLLMDQDELARQRRGGEGVVVVRHERPPQLERGAGHPQDLERLPGVEVPDDHGVAELLHGLRVLDQLPERPHVVLPATEGRGEHAVEIDVHPHVVAIGRLGRHPDGPDELPVIAILGQARPAAVVLGVGQRRDEHAPRQRVERMRADQAARVLHEGLDGLDELGLGRISGDVEDEDLARVEPACPEIASVVGDQPSGPHKRRARAGSAAGVRRRELGSSRGAVRHAGRRRVQRREPAGAGVEGTRWKVRGARGSGE